MLHPAAWIALWGVMAILLQVLEPRWLAAIAVPVLALAAYFAGREVLRLLRRARWLLLTIGILFVFATPGERLPVPFGSVGLSVDGLVVAGEHLLRLVVLLATLAWLWRALGYEGLLSGLHCLLHPLGSLRDRIVVRLVLALDYVERDARARDWRAWLGAGLDADDGGEPTDIVRLAVRPLRLVDRTALLACGAVLMLMLFK
ncbi:CbiQ family ECF transporter T component [Sulfurisoma sediminicola]|uniref:Cobalt transport protein n=1 Tax=Sulfurisoma sediminicola TaxID=1381557 RepID=A0A497XA00_9PROT|nr:CbiQ family ECF transporter T component [Sulfurisoma sediminicola]RLJ62784.1 cobalt transport protein [Sulfurisoma sediminicola]